MRSNVALKRENVHKFPYARFEYVVGDITVASSKARQGHVATVFSKLVFTHTARPAHLFEIKGTLCLSENLCNLCAKFLDDWFRS